MADFYGNAVDSLVCAYKKSVFFWSLGDKGQHVDTVTDFFMTDGSQRRGLYCTATSILMVWFGLVRSSLGTRYLLVGACWRPGHNYRWVDGLYKHPPCPFNPVQLGVALVGFVEIPTPIALISKVLLKESIGCGVFSANYIP